MPTDEQESIRREVESILGKYGIPLSIGQSSLSPADSRRIRDLAMQVILGNIDRDEVAHLSKEHTAELFDMIQRIIALKGQAPLQDLQERNPYYDVFGSKMVRDGPRRD
jgi:argonaute-like protein implicated in RNA metabolism and viral defense